MKLRLLVFCSLVFLAAARAAESPKDPGPALAATGRGMVQVEFELQYDRGEAPYGVVDEDHHSAGNRMNSLGELVLEERPLETSGFLVGAQEVVAMDPCVHPRFIKAITVRLGAASSTARVVAYARGQWAVRLALDQPLADSTPLTFLDQPTTDPLMVANYFRQDGQMIRMLMPFPSVIVETTAGTRWLSADNQGVAVTTAGKVAGIVMNRRLPADRSWQGPPSRWSWMTADEFSAALQSLETLTGKAAVRVRLSFRSPKANPNQMRERFRRNADDETDDQATERDVVGVALPGGRVAVLANIKPSITARLERTTVFAGSDSDGVPAKFVASLKEFSVLVVEPERPLPSTLEIDVTDPANLISALLLRADIDVQGENRSQYFHLARIAGVRVGPKTQGYPELSDSNVRNTFLFSADRKLVALPLARRERLTPARDAYNSNHDGPQTTPARLLIEAIQGLPATADPANVPVEEADENRLAWLGVELQPLTRELARENRVADQTRDGSTGAIVTYVHPDSPAAKAGLKPGTILLRMRSDAVPAPIDVHVDEDFTRAQGFPWERLDEVRDQFFDRIPTPWPPVETAFTRALTDLGFGSKVSVELVADGQPSAKDFEVIPGPTHYESAARFKSEHLGLTVRDLTYDVRRYLQRKTDEPGVVISKIEPGSRASVAGVKPYELITHVDEKPVTSVKDFEDFTKGGGEMKLTLKRMARGRIVTIKAAAGS
jgi:serine protease Do